MTCYHNFTTDFKFCFKVYPTVYGPPVLSRKTIVKSIKCRHRKQFVIKKQEKKFGIRLGILNSLYFTFDVQYFFFLIYSISLCILRPLMYFFDFIFLCFVYSSALIDRLFLAKNNCKEY